MAIERMSFTPLTKTHTLPSFMIAVMTIWSSTVELKSTYM